MSFRLTSMAGLVHRDYSSEFVSGVGDTVTIRKPASFEAQEFDRTSGIAIQSAAENGIDVKLDKLLDVSFEVTAEQLTLEIGDFSTQLLQPAMGIGRTNLPTVVLPGGVMAAGPDLLTLEKIGTYSAQFQRGEITAEQFAYYQRNACPSCGACSFMGTACTMQIMAEALGLALPGTALLPFASGELPEAAGKAGQQAMWLAGSGLTARDIVTRDSFENAIIVHAFRPQRRSAGLRIHLGRHLQLLPVEVSLR